MRVKQIIENLSSILSTELFEIGGKQVTLGTLLVAGLVIALTFGLSSLAQRGVRRGMMRRGGVDEGVVVVTNKLLHYVALFVGFGIALRLVGFDLSTLFAAGAIFAVGIGFAMQNIAQNFVSGIILLVERAITPGDVLEVDGRIVRVLRMGIRATIARSRDGEDVIVPNSMLVQSLVRNFTLGRRRLSSPNGSGGDLWLRHAARSRDPRGSCQAQQHRRAPLRTPSAHASLRQQLGGLRGRDLDGGPVACAPPAVPAQRGDLVGAEA